MVRTVTVLIADDDAAVRDALADLLADEASLTLVAVAATADEAVQLAAREQPQVALLDVRMPGGGGLRAAREIAVRSPSTRFLALSVREDPESVYEMLRLGASGYLVKGASDREIVEAIHRAARSQLSMSAELAAACFKELFQDVSERKRADLRLRKTEEEFRGLLESSPDAMLIVDLAGVIQRVNVQAQQLFGFKNGDLLGQRLEILLPERFHAAYTAHRAKFIESPQRRSMGMSPDLAGRRQDGTEFPADVSLNAITTGETKLVVAVVRDVTDRKRSEQALEASLQLLRKTERERQELLVHLVRAQEAERVRIAADIHDDSIQAMVAAALRLQQLRKRLSTETEVEAVDKLEEAFQGAITRLRHLMFNLRPVALERSGLAAALRAQLEQVQTETGLGFELANHLTAEPPPETRVILYRIAMEALTNVRKHAGAHLVLVRLENADQGWQVQIDDDGSGFTPTENGSAPGHLGLTAMRERAQLAGGWWKVASQPGAGTSVTFWLPAVSEPIPSSPAVLPVAG
jgi:PAS domain S-box-containing protein